MELATTASGYRRLNQVELDEDGQEGAIAKYVATPENRETRGTRSREEGISNDEDEVDGMEEAEDGSGVESG